MSGNDMRQETTLESLYQAFSELRSKIESEYVYANGEMRTARLDYRAVQNQTNKDRMNEWSNYMSGLHFALAMLDHYFPVFFDRYTADIAPAPQPDASEGGAEHE